MYMFWLSSKNVYRYAHFVWKLMKQYALITERTFGLQGSTKGSGWWEKGDNGVKG